MNFFSLVSNLFKNYSDMCEMKTVLVSVCLILLVTASFCMYWIYTEKNVGENSKIKSQKPLENYYKKYCLNVGEC